MSEQYYTRQEVAAKLSVCLRTIERRIASGELIDIKIGLTGRGSRISESALQDFIALRTEQQSNKRIA